MPTFDLSPVQLIATALAAVTATFAASFLGVAGTVLGAALFSVVTAVGKEVFGTSLRRTGTRVAATAPVTRVRPRVAVAGTDTDTDDTDGTHTDSSPPQLPAPAPSPRLRPASLWKRVALVSVVVFVGVLACVTVVEVFTGRPVSDLVRGEAGKGTSLFGGQQVITRTAPATTPTVTVTVTPKVSYTTPTVTRTAPPVTKSETPTSRVTARTSGSPSGTPSTSAPGSGSGTP